MNTSDAVWQTLSEYVDTVFLVPGGGASFLVDALGRSGLRYVAMLHEQGAGYAAVGYAMNKGFGVCLTTSGPGASNAVTPCLAAWMDSVPVIFISGNVRRDWQAIGQRSRGVQEADITAIVRPITKKAHRASYAKGTITALMDMIATARDGRPGPVWLDIPQDVQGEAYV